MRRRKDALGPIGLDGTICVPEYQSKTTGQKNVQTGKNVGER